MNSHCFQFKVRTLGLFSDLFSSQLGVLSTAPSPRFWAFPVDRARGEGCACVCICMCMAALFFSFLVKYLESLY